MEEGTAIGVVAVVLTLAVLLSAAVSDWREREVSDRHWLILGISGLLLFVLYSVLEFGFRWELILMSMGTIMLIADILWDKDFNPILFYPLVALLFIVPLYGNMSDPLMVAWASIPLCYLLYLGLYIFDIIRGGADAKCLITLSMMFPIYPTFFGFPLIGVADSTAAHIFVFSFSVFFIAAVMMIPIALYFVIRNIGNGKSSFKIFQGYRLDIDVAKRSKVWPIEDVRDGEIIGIGIPDEKDIEEIYKRFESEGIKEVWVTPMIPFLIPITIATIFIIVIGNPLFFIL